jgi:hypothetical protein
MRCQVQEHIEETDMAEDNVAFRLPASEFRYLRQLSFADESLTTLIRSQGVTSHDTAVVRLSRVQAERLRDYLTARLAAVGFDENYLPNEQGQMLENLIDRFHLD